MGTADHCSSQRYDSATINATPNIGFLYYGCIVRDQENTSLDGRLLTKAKRVKIEEEKQGRSRHGTIKVRMINCPQACLADRKEDIATGTGIRLRTWKYVCQQNFNSTGTMLTHQSRAIAVAALCEADVVRRTETVVKPGAILFGVKFIRVWRARHNRKLSKTPENTCAIFQVSEQMHYASSLTVMIPQSHPNLEARRIIRL
ncbi:uncharacterized protein BBA_10139 [Beauveria bassiana ARSEF 2860]|uniref:Uncharacterized protein n=1 Tax=Beauveria bassiana (strain ARSEF 2860) TaxID=655819 RepID=J4VQE9_BEAB2|nr:uncharacterized protein BBA_10139 [Beauveria bassiana ARSEF 2860]EJP60915.1 hypothetical protein BBA_10139 [Beauveria bassiana ARSEF 2860]